VRHQLRDILLLVVPHFSLTGRIGSRTSQPAASNCGGVSHAGRMTSEPFDAVSERARHAAGRRTHSTMDARGVR